MSSVLLSSFSHRNREHDPLNIYTPEPNRTHHDALILKTMNTSRYMNNNDNGAALISGSGDVLVPAGSCCFLMVPVGSCWFLLVPLGSCWFLPGPLSFC